MTRPFGQSTEGRAITAVFQEDAQLLCPSAHGFEALHSYKLTGQVDDDKVVFDLEATYLLVFSSQELVSDEFFEIFKDMNLAVHTWPFFRELVSSMTGRTSLPTLTLPLRITG
jgi:preprotein translocase subunit SecB